MTDSTNIEFEKIPRSIRKPGVYTEYNNKDAVSTLPINEQEVLIIAPMLGGDSDFTKPVKVFSDVEAEKLFGAGSTAHLMSRQAISNNELIRLSVMGIRDHSAGIKASGSVTFNSTVTSAGLVTVAIAGKNYQIAAEKGEEATAIASRLEAVINSSLYCPVVASTNEKVLTLTAKEKGEIGNEIALSAYTTAQSLDIELSAFSGGQRNAQIESALASIAGKHYHIIISAFSDAENTKALRTHLENMSSPIEKKPAIGVLGFRGSLAQATTLGESLNSERLTIAWYKGAIESNAILAAGYGAVIAYEEDPARPLNTLEIKGLTLTDDSQKPTFSEFNQALFNGVTPLEVVGPRVQIVRAITTYRKNVTGTDDPSWLDLTSIRTMDYVRKAVETRLNLRFPREKLHDKKVPKVRSEILDVLYRLEAVEIIENVDKHKKRLIVVRNPNDVNRVDTKIPSDVVNGLHVLANQIDLIL
ncbi:MULTISPECIES: phage tail sheath subtilisin-like domain-containing protein [Pasteurellaceae]|uniref:Phage tail sheath subtilisin-like domain-containing protein n=1 Tax=Pasteurella atlantica TaxID=2827233 RepID=A0AAW8CRD6_9PAST|nr:phage tail sheath subtilisin-like domain-containing protein [Pasteurella atlantica]MBR0574073.1 phage tail sheath subtilisin-like domain-containing protein [Pasteurella atlantica]MDP8040104.1 phage tail sheath subtilisin-like domain-containing protein [Pasteurella atlantica]MDP8042217.1 phage tail sheath subtilisin-like domain-containing protein [Pasteurella atlantica]MDP8044376.1 phage tail sheath subtilisin-like domain-containing protein [Pasteurella atlantica]MDP8046376.1 phage tail shea